MPHPFDILSIPQPAPAKVAFMAAAMIALPPSLGLASAAEPPSPAPILTPHADIARAFIDGAVRADDATLEESYGPREAVRPCRVVFGYLPYWESASSIRWDHLTHLSCFSIEVDGTGAIVNRRGWPWTTTINAARANGVKVVLTFTLFNDAALQTLLTTPANQQRLFENIRSTVAGNADGVNIDFEGTAPSTWAPLMDEFAASLRAYLNTNLPGTELSFATPAVNWNNHWNFAAIAPHADHLFIMGYDFNGSWSTTTGPVAPLTGGSINITNPVTTQYAAVRTATPQKLVLGVPYYGFRWRTNTDAAGATVTSAVGSILYASAQPGSFGTTRRWHTPSQTPWFAFQSSGQWNQVWYDDAESLGLKFDLARSNNLGGVGIWALGYDDDRPELWDVIRARFIDTCPPTNDACSNPRTVVAGIPAPFNTTNAAATPNLWDLSCSAPANSTFGPDVWFRWTATIDGLATFSTCGSSFDTQLALFQGSACPSGFVPSRACDNNSCGTASAASIPVALGDTILIRVGGIAGSRGTGTLDVAIAPFCTADLDRSGGIPDIDDVIAFFDAFALGEPLADINASGGIPDIDDIIAFFDAFAAGC